MPQLHLILGKEINFIKKTEDVEDYLNNYAGPALLENIRQFSGEKENDKEFASKLAKGFDLYINNDFAVSHRNHASVTGISKLLPTYTGFLVEEEISQLEKFINAPKEGKLIIIGGAKAETKVPVIKNFIDRSEKILLGGVVANDVLAKKGMDMDGSIFDKNFEELLAGLDVNDPRIVLPEDFHFSDKRILDIGPKSIKRAEELINDAKMIIWNGPFGLFEDERYANGTYAIARAVSNAEGFRVVGGGDTIEAIGKLGILDKFDFVSTGGGAMLAFLGGEKLPGLEALGYYR